ncbi:hypothetical protein P8797_17340 [Bacillus subtilis]|nr:hypothetical protein [Bacillus subtilis]MEC0363949.1 hypothetical protein [Bacillus subtilis]
MPNYTHQIFWSISLQTPAGAFNTKRGVEGLVLTEEEKKLLERRFHGEITEEEYIRKALELSYSR